MKKPYSIFMLISLLMAGIMLPSCTRAASAMNGSGNVVDRDIDVSEFNSLNASGVFTLDVKQAEAYRVTLSIDDNLISRVRFTQEHKTLKLDIEAPASFFPSSLKVTISMPQIIGLNLSDGANATISGFKSSQPFSLFLSGKSTLEGSLESGEMTYHLSDASAVILSGFAPSLNLVSLDGSKLDLKDFSLYRAQVKMDDASEAIVNVSGQFDVILDNKSKVFFLGNPIFTNISVSGGSTMAMVQK